MTGIRFEIPDRVPGIRTGQFDMHIIVGLGNPGMKYARTRHNIGFKIAEAFARRGDGAVRIRKTDAYHVLEMEFNGAPVAIIKPMLYMNRSGHALDKAPYNLRGENDVPLVIFDDVSLEFGMLRFRAKGSAGGHKGMKDIIDVLGTNEIHRLRVGVDRNEDMPLEDYVLRPFRRSQEKVLPDLLEDAADAVEFYIENGIEAAMNKFNTKNKTQPDDEE